MQNNTRLFSIFKQFPHLKVLLSEKKDGGMKVRYELGNDTEALLHREKFFNKYSVLHTKVVIAQLAQKNKVSIVTENNCGNYIAMTDGLITQSKGVFLSVTVADCLPIYIYDQKEQVISLLHAGWKGLDTHIISAAINLLIAEYNVLPENLLVGIGPGIEICHFQVQKDVLMKFSEYKDVVEKREEEYFINLKKIAKQQLINNGIKEENIEINPACTYCEKNTYFSYRRDKIIPLQAMVASIGIKV